MAPNEDRALHDKYHQPFPYFGGKRKPAHEVWRRFGNVPHYVEPFAGGLGCLINRRWVGGAETVNDVEPFVANFWRAVKADPEGLAEHCDWPVFEADMHARHRYLMAERGELRRRITRNPFVYDSRIAAWWAWGQAIWIGNGWCDPRGGNGRLCKPSTTGRRGVHQHGLHQKKPRVGATPTYGTRGLHGAGDLLAYFRALQERFRDVTVMCGDWQRAVTDGVLSRDRHHGVLLDPPYRRGTRQFYADHDKEVAEAAYRWAVSRGLDISMSIAYCCEAGEFPVPPGWTCYNWKSHGYGKGAPEWIMFSPFCRPVGHAPGYAGVAKV